MLKLEQQIAQRGSNQGKKPIRYFVSYAHADKPDLNRFLEVFNPQLDTSASFQFSPWTDSNILPGERWRERIDQALKQCAFGLLLVSPNFLASNFIGREELPVLLAKQIVVPIALHPILFDGSMDLKGLESRQVFRDTKGRAFDQCGRMHTRRAFALELFSKLDTLFTKSPFTLG